MVHMPTPTTILRALLSDLPVGSLRALAAAAGVPHSTLSRIRSGALDASDAVVDSVASVLERWGRDTTAAARRLRSAKG
jgi:DNA-binding LacI/PurR family transcriptional regulator